MLGDILRAAMDKDDWPLQSEEAKQLLMDRFFAELFDLHPVQLGHLLIEIQAVREIRSLAPHPGYYNPLAAIADRERPTGILPLENDLKIWQHEIDMIKNRLRQMQK